MFHGMKIFLRFRILVPLLTALVVFCRPAGAQIVGFSVTSSAGSILVSNSLTYTINVTNFTGLTLADAVVTNVLSASIQPVSVTYSQGFFTNYGNVVVFDLGPFGDGQIALLTLTVQPTAVGYITNNVSFASITVTNTASTNLVTQVTNVVTQADLAVAMTGPVQAVVTNDLTTYGVTVVNQGTDAAPNVMLTNTLPSSVMLLGVSPAQSYTVSSNNLIFNLGTLASGGSTNLQFTIEPTNAGVLTFSASVEASGISDPNLTNNTASTNITVIGYLAGTLIAVTNSAQTINLQNGLTEQTVLLSNVGDISVPAARIVVTGLTNQLFNAVGTNNGHPFVDYSTALAAGKSVNLLLQYNPRGFFRFTNGQLHAYAVPEPNWTPPKATATSTNLIISHIVRLSNGNMLIEWPSITNRAYTVIYSDNVLFSNAMIAPCLLYTSDAADDLLCVD